jgi:hypothetical protein
MEIKVKIYNHYGKECIYPETFTNEICTLTKQTTISRLQINALKKMGFTFKVVNVVADEIESIEN